MFTSEKKRFLAVLLTLALLFTYAVPVFAGTVASVRIDGYVYVGETLTATLLNEMGEEIY